MKEHRMKEHTMKSLTAVTMALILGSTLFAGCGSSHDNAVQQDASAADSAVTAQTAAAAVPETEEKEPVLNIYCIGEDFKSRVQDYYPGYEITDDDSGLIGNTEVRWHVYSDESSYREDLDALLEKQAGAGADGSDAEMEPDERVDLFIADEAYVRDYVESDLALDVIGDLGIAPEELADQFPYTQQIAQDPSGRIKALTWQATPGVFAYRRSIARDVLGTDDPEKVQEILKSQALAAALLKTSPALQ